MSTLERALEIAVNAHAGTRDKQGGPYVLHPIRVMQGVDGADAKIVAVLHDVVEDTEVTIDQLREAGFSPGVLESVRRMTHRKDQSYADYVIAAKGDEIARQVKLSDLRDNMSPERILLRDESWHADTQRIQRYILSYRYLTDRLPEAEYREAMRGVEAAGGT